jgi:hypothetical protein
LVGEPGLKFVIRIAPFLYGSPILSDHISVPDEEIGKR